MQPFRVVASDMDGTLLNNAHAISPYTMETLFQLYTRHQVSFIFATGRHHLSVQKARTSLTTYFADKVAATPHKAGETAEVPGFYLVSSNGARIHRPDGSLLVEHHLPTDIVQSLYAHYGLPFTGKRGGAVVAPSPTASPTTATGPGPLEEVMACEGEDEHPEEVVSTSAYTTNEWFITVPFLPLPDMEKKFGVRPTVVPFDPARPENATKSVFDDFPLEGVGKVCFRCSDKVLLDKLEKAIRAEFGDRVSIAMSSVSCLDVMPQGISKASALAEVARVLSSAAPKDGAQEGSSKPITLQDMIAFGDSMNDEEMLRRVGKGCVMKNAQPRLKAALQELCEVIGINEEDGVAKKLRQVFGIDL